MSGKPAPTVTPVPSAGGGSVGGNNNPGGPKVCSDEKPATPLLVSLTRNGKSMTLTWNRSDKANNYAIEYGITPGNYIYGFVGVGDLTQYTVNDLDPNQTYYAVVRAMNGCAMGDPSNELPKGGIGGGEVLGASTLAGTGTAAESLAWYAIAIGSLLVTASAYGYRFKKA